MLPSSLSFTYVSLPTESPALMLCCAPSSWDVAWIFQMAPGCTQAVFRGLDVSIWTWEAMPGCSSEAGRGSSDQYSALASLQPCTHCSLSQVPLFPSLLTCLGILGSQFKCHFLREVLPKTPPAAVFSSASLGSLPIQGCGCPFSSLCTPPLPR